MSVSVSVPRKRHASRDINKNVSADGRVALDGVIGVARSLGEIDICQHLVIKLDVDRSDSFAFRSYRVM